MRQRERQRYRQRASPVQFQFTEGMNSLFAHFSRANIRFIRIFDLDKSLSDFNSLL